MEKDILHGYALPLPRDKIGRIRGALLAPLNIHQRQNTIDEVGRIVPIDCLTHDQSYEFGSGTSVNRRTRKEDLPACLFGQTMKRISITGLFQQDLNIWQAHNSVKDRHKIGLQKRASQLGDSNPDMHPARRPQPSVHGSAPHIWRKSLPFTLGSLWPSQLATSLTL